MNKDALLATGIGFIVGLVVTGLVLYGPTVMKNVPKISLPNISIRLPSKEKPKATPTPSVQVQTSHTVSIKSPIAEAIESSDKLLVSGSTTPGSTVVISGPSDETVVVANGDGTYAGKVTLSEGKNSVTVFSVHKQSGTAQQSVTVYYTPEQW